MADAMMETQDHGRAAGHVLDEVDVPQWLGKIEWGAGEIADEALELHHIARCRQGHAMNVRIEIEVAIGFPVGRADRQGRFHHAHGEAIQVSRRTSSVLRKRSKWGGLSSSETPVIIIRLVGSSMCSQAESTGDICFVLVVMAA